MVNQKLATALSEMYWAIEEDKLRLIYSIVYDKERYIQLAKEAKEGNKEEKSPDVEDLPYVAKYGAVSYMRMHGVMMKRMNVFDAMSGGISTEMFGYSLDKLLDDDKVQAIVIGVDSPGGSVTGTSELADKIYAGRKKKQIIAVADSLAASAAYWVGSQASEFYATSSAVVGSIGVYMENVNVRKRYEDNGVSVEFFRVPEGKAKPNSIEDVDKDTREHIMQSLNEIYDDFVSAVARGRGVDEKTVRESFGGGRVVTAKNALKVNMIDGIGNLADYFMDTKEKIRMSEEDKQKAADLQKQVAALTKQLNASEKEKTDLSASLEKEREERAMEAIRQELKGFKNLNLEESHVKLLYSLDKSDPGSATLLRATFKTNDERIGNTNLNPDGETRVDSPKPVPAAGVSAADDLDKQALKLMTENSNFKTPADAALHILQSNPELADRIATEAGSEMFQGEAEEF